MSFASCKEIFPVTREGQPLSGPVYRYFDGWFERFADGVLMRVRLQPVPQSEILCFGEVDPIPFLWAEDGRWLAVADEAEERYGGRDIPGDECLNGLDVPPQTERSPFREDWSYPAWRLGRGIPAEVRRALTPFPCEVFKCLSLLHVLGKPWEDLICRHPALAWSLASLVLYEEMEEDCQRMRQLKKALSEGDDQLLALLGMPSAAWVWDCLKRFTGQATPAEFSNLLWKLLTEPGARRLLKHERPLDRRYMELILRSKPRQVSAALLRQVLSPDLDHSDFRWVSECLLDGLLAELDGGDVPRFRSLFHLDRWHREEAVLLGRTGFSVNACRGTFPPVPFPGNRYIVPVESWEELEREAMVMGHPTLTKYDFGNTGCRTGVYQILRPERCTAAIGQQFDGTWVTYYFSCPYGRSPRYETFLFLRNWLKQRASIQA